MKDFAIHTLVVALKDESFKLIPHFIQLAQIIIGILLAIELIKEAIGLAHGQGFHLSKKLITWVFVMIMISAAYHHPGSDSGLASGIYETAKKFGEYSFEQFETALESFLENCVMDEPSLGIGSIFKPKKMFFAVGFAVATAIGAVCFLLIYIMICGSYGSLALLIVFGPVAFAFMINEDFRHFGIQWVNAIITSLFTIIVYGVTTRMVTAILSETVRTARESLNSTNLFASIMVLLIGPMLSIGLVYQGPKVVMSLLGGVGGGGEMAAGFMGGAVWSAASSAGKAVWQETKRAWNGEGKGGGAGGNPPPLPGQIPGGGEPGGRDFAASGAEQAPGAVENVGTPGQAPKPSIGERLMPNFIRGMEKVSTAVDRYARRGVTPPSGDKVPDSYAEGAHLPQEDPGPAGE